MRGRKPKITETVQPAKPATFSSWTESVRLKKALMHPYRISGKVGDIVEVPTDLVDELIKAKKVEKV